MNALRYLITLAVLTLQFGFAHAQTSEEPGQNQPHGSNTFLAAAGALGKAIKLMKEEAYKRLPMLIAG